MSATDVAARDGRKSAGLPPRISIVTPTFNMGRFIEHAILGVLQQGYPNVEHIVVDGGSTDQTLSILEKYPHLEWISERDEGLYDALDKGLRMATGELIGWCNADDLYLPGTFNFVADYFAQNRDVDMIYGDYREIDERGVAFRVRREVGFSDFLFRWLHINLVPTPSAFWRRSIHDGGIWFDDGRHRYANDYRMCVDVHRAGHRIRHVNVLLADFRRHEGAISTALLEDQRREFEAMVRENAGNLGQAPRAVYAPLRHCLMLWARTMRTASKVVQGAYFDYFRG